MRTSKVAIACQGGGSHTAFTAGVLMKLLTSPRYGKDFQITALTGTSGGALCAGLVWSRLLAEPGAPAGDPDQAERAARALHEFWMDLACDPLEPSLDNPLYFAPWRRGPFDYLDAFGNAGLVAQRRLNPLAEQECGLISVITRRRMLELLSRHIPLELLARRPLDQPALRVGATDILQGYTNPINVEDHTPEEFHTILLASASIPPLFGPTTLDRHYYWDGLYSHNPPIDCLTNLRAGPPDEIWIIQINPETRTTPPRNPSELVDRRNELTGNLSLAAELYHIDVINWMLEQPAARRGLEHLGYRPIKLRVVSLRADLDLASKFDRSRPHIERLIGLGKEAAGDFFSDDSVWRMRGAEGVHLASVQPGRIGRREPGTGIGQFSPFCCSVGCPWNSVCNLCTGLAPCVERAFDLTQTFSEARA